MDPDLPNALVTPAKNKARNRTENRYWDYKEELSFNDAYQIAEFAKDVLAFHNTEGGLIAVGITDGYTVPGIPAAAILNPKELRDKVRRFVGSQIELFQDSFEVQQGRFVWLIFVPKYSLVPKSMESDGPHRLGRAMFSKGHYFYRDGFSSEHLTAYTYEVDEPFFRLLSPSCEVFVGRDKQKDDIKAKLDLRHPIIALDGLGGVGKTAIAVQAVRELHQARKYLFIVSISAKSKVWVGHVKPRRAAFAGLHGLLSEIADVIPYIDKTDDTLELKRQLIEFMRGQNGLLLIDNLEEIYDESVLKFISQEIPDPVKVLVTSRVDKDLGALTISIPAMSDQEASELLSVELDRLGYQVIKGDQEHTEAILAKAGGVPLAIKWAAQIASERKSLRDASATLRGAGAGKQELLNFCFSTMFDALTPTAKDAARLIPYLESDWNPVFVGIALDVPTEIARSAIYELSDKGIIFRGRDDRPDDYVVLPLTKEYLFNKWHESHLLSTVERRFGQMFSSTESEGFLLDWDNERRLTFLTSIATEAARRGDYARALKLVRVAQGWLEPSDTVGPEVKLRFLEGQTLFMTENKVAGLAHMEQAIKYDIQHQSLDGDDVLFFAQAAFSHGGGSAEKGASEAILSGITKGGTCSAELLLRFIDCNIKRGDTKLIATVISRIDDGPTLCAAFNRMEGLLNQGTVAYTYEKEWSRALGRLLDSPAVDKEDKKYYLTKFGRIRERSLRAG